MNEVSEGHLYLYITCCLWALVKYFCLFCEKLVNSAKSLWLYVQVCLTSVMPWRGHYSWLISLRLFSSACGCLWKDFGPDSAAFLLKVWLSVDLCVSVCQKNKTHNNVYALRAEEKKHFLPVHPSQEKATRETVIQTACDFYGNWSVRCTSTRLLRKHQRRMYVCLCPSGFSVWGVTRTLV